MVVWLMQLDYEGQQSIAITITSTEIAIPSMQYMY